MNYDVQLQYAQFFFIKIWDDLFPAPSQLWSQLFAVEFTLADDYTLIWELVRMLTNSCCVYIFSDSI